MGRCLHKEREYAEFSRRGFLQATGAVTAGSLIFSWAGTPGAAAAEQAAAGQAAAGPAGSAPNAGVRFTSTGNPVITSIYTADPDAFVHNGRLYLDVDRDEAPLGVNDFVMREWHLFSTADLVHWTDHGVRMTLADFGWANRNAWAPQMVHRDGKFFWYVPVQKAATNSMSIGVAVGDTPLGPFTDAIGGPLIDNTTANHSSFDIDPTVLIDDDGQAYLYRGSFSSPRAAKLKRNMIELADLGDPGGGATGPRVAGRLGTAVRLNGSADHVALPAGIVSGLDDFTISGWVKHRDDPAPVEPGKHHEQLDRARAVRRPVPGRRNRRRAAIPLVRRVRSSRCPIAVQSSGTAFCWRRHRKTPNGEGRVTAWGGPMWTRWRPAGCGAAPPRRCWCC